MARLKLRKPFRNVVQSDHLLDHRINLLFCHQTDHLFSHKRQVDLRLSKTVTRHLELFVGIDNLLDAGDAYSVLRPFTVYGGARGRY